MAEAPILALAGPAVKIIGDITSAFIRDGYHIEFEVEDELRKLESNLSAIQSNLRDVDGVPLAKINEATQDWLRKLNDAALDAEDVLEIYAARVSSLASKKNRVVATRVLRWKASRDIKKVTSRLDEITSERSRFQGRRTPERDVQQAQEAGPFPSTCELYGRTDEKAKIIDWLMSDEFDTTEGGEFPTVRCIVGMGGIGKTTLAQFVYNDPGVTAHFTNLIWVDVKRDFVLERVGRDIVEFATEMEIKLTAWASVEKRLGDLMKGKKFLLVLDDVVTVSAQDWQKLHQLLKNGEKGSRVVVTSRTDEIQIAVRARDPLILDGLPGEECWLLFAKTAFEGGQPPSAEIGRIARRIVGKCGSLPLAITAMASMLYSCDDLHKWKSVEKDGVWRAEQENARNAMPHVPVILPSLRLSYEYLPSHLKRCFVYCCIFPQGYMFDRSDLVKLWRAQRYAASSQDGTNYFNILRSRSFFQPLHIDNKERYKIHDFFHDLAVWVSGQSTCRIEDDKSCFTPEHCRHISVFCKEVHYSASAILKATKLRTILQPVAHLRDFKRALAKIFTTLSYLRVLDLSFTTVIDLPYAIGNLKLLCYLDLSHTEIQRLPDGVCSLINLQTLKLLGCTWLYELPQRFSNLTSLCHLELDEMFWNKCTFLPPGIGALTNLHNLHFFRVGSAITHGLDQLQRMNSLTGKLHISELENTASPTPAACLQDKESLEEVVLEWSDGSINLQDLGVQETLLEELRPHPSLKKLKICGYNGRRFAAWISNPLIDNLTHVSFSSCIHVQILSLGQLPHLQQLHLKGMQNLEEWPEMEYPNLVWLKISKCPKLIKLPTIFPMLRVMKIKECHMLKVLPVTLSLLILNLINNIMLESWNEIMVLPYWASYINLRELEIKNCPRLRGLPTICPQKLEISCCSLIGTLPSENCSGRLQHLALDGCNDGTLVEAIPRNSSAYSLVLSNIARLNSLPSNLTLSGLKALYINRCADLVSLSSANGSPLAGFTALTLLSVCGCSKLTTFTNSLLPSSLELLIVKSCLNLQSFGPSNCLVSLTALTDLQLEDCPRLRSFPGDGLPASLKHLCIRRCPLLTQRFNDGVPYGPMLANIVDVDIDSI